MSHNLSNHTSIELIRVLDSSPEMLTSPDVAELLVTRLDIAIAEQASNQPLINQMATVGLTAAQVSQLIEVLHLNRLLNPAELQKYLSSN